MMATAVIAALQALVAEHGDQTTAIPDWEYGGVNRVQMVEPFRLLDGSIQFVIADQPGYN